MIYIYLKKKFLFIIIIMSTQDTKDVPIKYTDFDVKRFVTTPFQEAKKKGKDGKKGMGLITWPRYDHPKLGSNEIPIIRFPNIDMDSYGIPRESEYFPTPLKRSFVKVPLDESKPDIKKLIKKLKEIDEYFTSDVNVNLLFGKKAHIYKNNYCPLYNEACNTQYDDNNEDNVKKTGFKLPFIKLKLNVDVDSGDIKSKLSINEIINNIETPVEVHGTKSIDDFIKVLCYRCELKPEVELTKLWAQAATMPNPKWGVSAKLIKGLIKPPAKNNSKASQNYEDSAFINSDNENDDNSDNNDTKSVNKTSLKKIAQVDSDDSDDDSDEVEPPPAKSIKNTPVKKADSDDDSDEEVKPPPAKSTKNTPVKKADSDDDSDEEVKPPPAKSTKNTPVKKADSDDDSDEVKPVVKPTKTAKNTPVKKADSDDDSDEEVKPPPAKSTKNTLVKKADSDSDDEVKPPVKPPVKSSKSTKNTPVKKDDSDDDSDDEVKPPVKPTKTTKPTKSTKSAKPTKPPKSTKNNPVKKDDSDDDSDE